jgi:hypothetical protein
MMDLPFGSDVLDQAMECLGEWEHELVPGCVRIHPDAASSEHDHDQHGPCEWAVVDDVLDHAQYFTILVV